MSPIVKEYRRILLRITTVFFFGFRKSSRYFLSAVLKIFLSLLFFLCCFYFYCFCCLCRTVGFLFHCHDTVMVFHSFFQSFFVGVCAFRSFFQHCDPLIAAIFLCGTIYQITGCTLHFLPAQNYGFVRFGFCRHFCGRFWKCNLLCTALFAGQTAFDGFCIVKRLSAYRILIQEYGSGCLTDHRHFASLFAVDLIAGCTLYCLNGDLHCRYLFLGNALNAYDLRSLNGF